MAGFTPMKTLPKAKAAAAPKSAARPKKQTVTQAETPASNAISPNGSSSDGTTASANVTAIQSGPQEDAIAQRAYSIWLSNGCPDGCEEEHWHQAERELSRPAV